MTTDPELIDGCPLCATDAREFRDSDTARAIVRPVTLKDVSEPLPNGFHEARLYTIEVDIEHSVLRMQMDIDISDVDRRSPTF
jgi:hypothetical protein